MLSLTNGVLSMLHPSRKVTCCITLLSLAAAKVARHKILSIRQQGYVRPRPNRGGIDLALMWTDPSHD